MKKARPEMKRRSPRSGVSAAILGAAILVMAAPSFAQETPPQKQKPWYESIGMGVFLESTYTQNFNRPDSSTNQFRVFDTDAGSVRLDVAEVVVQKKASARGEAGFRVDAIAGSSIPHVTAASGLFRDDVTGNARNYDLLQAFASYVAPIGHGLKLDAGKFTTHMGYEVVEGPDGYNTNASHSLLFGWAVPITHTGLRITYPASDTFSAQVVVATGWDNVKDNNGSKSVGAQILYTPRPAVTMALNVMSGPEKPKNDTDQRHSLDYWMTWKANDRLSLAMNADYGNEEWDLPDGRRASWSGVAGYARVTLHERVALALRAEVFRDPDGERTGTSQVIREVTLTPEWKVAKRLVLRGDLRHDWSDEPVFERRGGQSRGQTTASLNVIYSF
jgi:Putative beta-barrel porin-2, OmpL-like. bbp2